MRKYNIINRIMFLSAFVGLLSSCSKDEFSPAMDERVLLSEIKLNVTPELPLLINTDTLISYTVGPEEAFNKEVVWSSSNEDVATVSDEGRILARRTGEAVITAMPKVGFGVTSSFKVQVIDRIITIRDILLTNEGDLKIDETSSLKLEWKTVPSEPTYPGIKWESLTPEIASVTSEGVVTGLSKGVAQIKATSTDPDHFSKVFEFTVTPITKVTKIEFEQTEMELGFGDVVKLKYSYEPSNATISTIKWESSDGEILSIDENGLISVNAYGSTTLKAYADYGDNEYVEASMTVNVPQGKISDNFDYVVNWKVDGKNGENLVCENGHLIITPVLQKQYDNGKTTSLGIISSRALTFHAGNYPIFAIKFKIPDDIYDESVQLEYYLDMWTTNQTPGGKYGEGTNKGNRQMTYKELGNGYHVYYADFTKKTIGTKDMMPTDKLITMENVVFEWWKIWFESGVAVCNVEIDWIKTFKSEDELNSFLENE